jgi:hypothetical protein
MATKASDPTMTGPNYASAEYAQQWRRGKRLRGEASEAVTEMMLDLAKIHVGDRVLEKSGANNVICSRQNLRWRLHEAPQLTSIT